VRGASSPAPAEPAAPCVETGIGVVVSAIKRFLSEFYGGDQSVFDIFLVQAMLLKSHAEIGDIKSESAFVFWV
jgi:hypothetical protein